MRSMTGCGRCQLMAGGYEMTVELKTVNHRFLDIACRLPRSLAFLEDKLRKGLQSGMKRGHVDVFLTVRRVDESSRQAQVDVSLARALAEAAAKTAEATGLANDMTVSRLMTMEGVVTLTEAEEDQDALSALCTDALRGAMAQVEHMRTAEGLALAADLTAHLDAAEALRTAIAQRAPLVVADYRARLTERLAKLPIEPVEPQRLAQEVALLADRCAIDEELSRLDSHIHQMRTYLAADGEIGKKMDFLIQEMNREANTIGSKASDAVIAQAVVNLKSEIEKLREQIQNVE